MIQTYTTGQIHMLTAWLWLKVMVGAFSPFQAQHAGGVITEEDFSNYSALVEKPVCGVYRGDFYPSSQGPPSENPSNPWLYAFGLETPSHLTGEKLEAVSCLDS